MATQTVQIPASAGFSGTLLIKLFAVGTDTVAYSQTATPGVNDPSLYSAAFIDAVSARYRAVLFNDATPVAIDHVTVDAATANYPVEGLQETAKAPELAAIAGGGVYSTVVRSSFDTSVVTFVWPVTGATITGEVSIDNGAYTAVAGTLAFLRSDGDRHLYTLTHDAADRPTSEGTARYKLTDGTYTKYVNLRVEGEVTANELTQAAVTDIFSTYVLPESYAVKGQTATPAQILYFMQQAFTEFAVDDVNIIVNKLDGTTAAATFVMDTATAPTTRARAT
jgi:hypothetical protein